MHPSLSLYFDQTFSPQCLKHAVIVRDNAGLRMDPYQRALFHRSASAEERSLHSRCSTASLSSSGLLSLPSINSNGSSEGSAFRWGDATEVETGVVNIKSVRIGPPRRIKRQSSFEDEEEKSASSSTTTTSSGSNINNNNNKPAMKPRRRASLTNNNNANTDNDGSGHIPNSAISGNNSMSDSLSSLDSSSLSFQHQRGQPRRGGRRHSSNSNNALQDSSSSSFSSLAPHQQQQLYFHSSSSFDETVTEELSASSLSANNNNSKNKKNMLVSSSMNQHPLQLVPPPPAARRQRRRASMDNGLNQSNSSPNDNINHHRLHPRMTRSNSMIDNLTSRRSGVETKTTIRLTNSEHNPSSSTPKKPQVRSPPQRRTSSNRRLQRRASMDNVNWEGRTSRRLMVAAQHQDNHAPLRAKLSERTTLTRSTSQQQEGFPLLVIETRHHRHRQGREEPPRSSSN